MELSQSPGRKSFQQSPTLASFLRAALAFMVHLPPAHRALNIEGDNSACAMTIGALAYPALI
jgi:hypothetical protein